MLHIFVIHTIEICRIVNKLLEIEKDLIRNWLAKGVVGDDYS